MKTKGFTLSELLITVVLLISGTALGYIFIGGKNAARRFGMTTHIVVKADQKLINVTWKDSNLWILTRPMHFDEKAETYKFTESSNLGLIEGKVLIEEKRTSQEQY